MIKKYIFVLFLFCVIGCAHDIDNDLVLDKVHRKESPVNSPSNIINISLETGRDSKPISIEFLGVGGFAFDFGGEKIITAPSYSNPTLWRSIPSIPIHINEDTIDRKLPLHLRDDYDLHDNNIKAILVGHSHYDHLLDVPYIMNKYLLEAKAYGSETMASILKEFGLPCSLTSPEKYRASVVNEYVDKDWVGISGTNIRILPITSHHPPHFMGYTAQTGFYKCTGSFEVKTAWDWKMGEVYSYVIDFMSNDKDIQYRIYYQDTATEIQLDENLQALLKGREVDIAILTSAGSGHAETSDFPAQIVRTLGAKIYIVGHWEDFFDNDGKPLKAARGTDENDFIKNLEANIPVGGKWIMPSPGRKLHIYPQIMPAQEKQRL